MNNWQIVAEYVDTHSEFTTAGINTLDVKPNVISLYRYELKKAKFIERVSPGVFRRLRYIGKLTVYQVKEIGFDLEMERDNAAKK